MQTRLRRERPRHHRALQLALRELLADDVATSSNPANELANLFFVDRNEPHVRQWTPALEDSPKWALEPAGRADHRQIVQLIDTAEGPESAALVQASLDQGEESFEVVREGPVTGVLSYQYFTAESGPARLSNRDGASALVRRFMLRNPLSGDDEALLIRWFLDAQDYQQPSPRVLTHNGRQTQLVLANPRLAYSFCVFRAPILWLPLWKSIDLPWQEVGTFTLGEHEYCVLAFLWRRRALRDVLIHGGNPPTSPKVDAAEPLSSDELRLKITERVANLARKVKLTPREVEILAQLCLGHTAEDIARNLAIRPRTVKFHQENLLRKTGASSRVELFRKLM
ncbi:MAG TPA: helix-turn-helix transcriptional regulator [Polyangiaceae bacterium]|nr:helix-turn-helix transcriptional regulator [Polyangiaceae bacterium]